MYLSLGNGLSKGLKAVPSGILPFWKDACISFLYKHIWYRISVIIIVAYGKSIMILLRVTNLLSKQIYAKYN